MEKRGEDKTEGISKEKSLHPPIPLCSIGLLAVMTAQQLKHGHKIPNMGTFSTFLGSLWGVHR